MCYWRRLSKRDTANSTIPGNSTNMIDDTVALIEDYGDSEHKINVNFTTVNENDNDNGHTSRSRRASRHLKQDDTVHKLSTTATSSNGDATLKQSPISDKVSLFSALRVNEVNNLSEFDQESKQNSSSSEAQAYDFGTQLDSAKFCYGRGEVMAFMMTIVALIVVAIGVTVGCCWRASNLKYYYDTKMSGINNRNVKLPNKKRNFAFVSPLDYLFSSTANQQAATLFNDQYNHHMSPMSPAPSSPSASTYCESLSSRANNNYTSHQSTAALVAPLQTPSTASVNHCLSLVKPWLMNNYNNRNQQIQPPPQQQQQQQQHIQKNQPQHAFRQNLTQPNRTLIDNMQSSGNLLLPVQSDRQQQLQQQPSHGGNSLHYTPHKIDNATMLKQNLGKNGYWSQMKM